ncbi:MAG: hypothetical protein AUK54_06630 [Helicobacteraceae bacterium CG2_30_36_10]|nr:MAG: hypothetical protein AUK54_06630 [Helicobacteraceae bacterium CG2_30_36_10]
MNLEQDLNQLITYLSDWTKNSQIVNNEIILCVNALEGKADVDNNTKLNLVLAKHMISSEEYLQKMEASFAELLEMIQKSNYVETSD